MDIYLTHDEGEVVFEICDKALMDASISVNHVTITQASDVDAHWLHDLARQGPVTVMAVESKVCDVLLVVGVDGFLIPL